MEVSYGCLVYQEQVMQVVRDLAGYSYGRSDLVRRAMGKKKMDVMEQERQYFIHGKEDENGNILKETKDFNKDMNVKIKLSDGMIKGNLKVL